MRALLVLLALVGCGGSEEGCPEGDVLALVGGQAEAVAPACCVGHGLCERACPTSAITLVFGTARRGVELPRVQGDYQTNVPGLYIVGELGGMGLVRNAFEQGRQAVQVGEPADGQPAAPERLGYAGEVGPGEERQGRIHVPGPELDVLRPVAAVVEHHHDQVDAETHRGAELR